MHCLPPSLGHALSSQKDTFDCRASLHKERGVPADIAQHEVLRQQMDQLPAADPFRPGPVRLQGRLDQDQVAHLPRDGEDQEGVQDHGHVSAYSLHSRIRVTGKAGHLSCELPLDTDFSGCGGPVKPVEPVATRSDNRGDRFDRRTEQLLAEMLLGVLKFNGDILILNINGQKWILKCGLFFFSTLDWFVLWFKN